MSRDSLAVTTSDGVTLRGEAEGPISAPLVILLHGGGQTRNAWSAELSLLASDGYRAAAFDLRGHGESDWSPDGDYRIQAHASDLRSVLREFPRPLAFVGASLGGLAAFYTIGTSREVLADSLVLVDIAPRVDPVGSARIQQFMRAHTGGFATIEDAAVSIQAYSPNRTKPVHPKGLAKNLRLREDGRYYWHWDPRILESKADYDPVRIVEDAMRASAGVTLPTLLVRGGASDLISQDSVAALKALTPQAEIFDVPAAGHMVAGDDNSTFHAGISEFLGRRREMVEAALSGAASPSS